MGGGSQPSNPDPDPDPDGPEDLKPKPKPGGSTPEIDSNVVGVGG